jgi:hypothetical protein
LKDDRVYLIHIFECIERIEQYTEGGSKFFFSDTKTQDAVLRNLHTLSESLSMYPRHLRTLILKSTGAASPAFEIYWSMIISASTSRASGRWSRGICRV